KPRFEIIQLDLYGSREITDFDGEKLSEKDYARKLGVRATPTMLFFKDPAEATKGGGEAVAWKVAGYLETEPFVNAFAYANQRTFAKGPDFIAWMKGPGEKVKVE
ncbi:MAG TPA: thioredoxin, partial [Candidatus Omnitrophota bacterium]|nr:thioredoxin [Candidatus Omnitrophota bacterium]